MGEAPQVTGPTLRQVLHELVGVWEGCYTHLDPAGTVLERFASRQETRIDGDAWFERIIYRPGESGETVLDFRARFISDGEVVFDDAAFEGHSRLVGERYLLFPYRWKNEPGVEVVELIALATADYRTRIWQRLRSGRLERVTIIEEHRRAEETPQVWY